jgi:hypothetical protein
VSTDGEVASYRFNDFEDEVALHDGITSAP